MAGLKIEISSESGDKILCRVAETFWSRFSGLMGKSPLPAGEGLLIRPCNSIHMFFMKFSVDVLFLDADFRVVRLIRDLVPGKIVGTVPGAVQVVEVTAGGLPGSFAQGVRLAARTI